MLRVGIGVLVLELVLMLVLVLVLLLVLVLEGWEGLELVFWFLVSHGSFLADVQVHG